MKTYDIFLFDADDTLYDFGMAEENAMKTLFGFCGFEYSEEILATYRDINVRAWADYNLGKVTKDELQILRFSRFFEAIGISYDIPDFNQMYLTELGKGTFLIDGAFEICKEIVSSGKEIYIITNGILKVQETRIKHSPLKDYISDFFVSEFVGYQKPDIKYFEYVLSHIPKIDLEKILIIGDSLLADIAGGNNAGIDTCWFNEFNKENKTEIVPTYKISKLSEIREFIIEG